MGEVDRGVRGGGGGVLGDWRRTRRVSLSPLINFFSCLFLFCFSVSSRWKVCFARISWEAWS